jgi:hypothetical protein
VGSGRHRRFSAELNLKSFTVSMIRNSSPFYVSTFYVSTFYVSTFYVSIIARRIGNTFRSYSIGAFRRIVFNVGSSFFIQAGELNWFLKHGVLTAIYLFVFSSLSENHTEINQNR